MEKQKLKYRSLFAVGQALKALDKTPDGKPTAFKNSAVRIRLARNMAHANHELEVLESQRIDLAKGLLAEQGGTGEATDNLTKPYMQRYERAYSEMLNEEVEVQLSKFKLSELDAALVADQVPADALAILIENGLIDEDGSEI